MNSCASDIVWRLLEEHLLHSNLAELMCRLGSPAYEAFIEFPIFRSNSGLG